MSASENTKRGSPTPLICDSLDSQPCVCLSVLTVLAVSVHEGDFALQSGRNSLPTTRVAYLWLQNDGTTWVIKLTAFVTWLLMASLIASLGYNTTVLTTCYTRGSCPSSVCPSYVTDQRLFTHIGINVICSLCQTASGTIWLYTANLFFYFLLLLSKWPTQIGFFPLI